MQITPLLLYGVLRTLYSISRNLLCDSGELTVVLYLQTASTYHRSWTEATYGVLRSDQGTLIVGLRWSNPQ